ncbi:MAG: hypothetical protein CMH57_02410 [Myxococcales bacterium]|nr:hypothetical protein [Myxococcales bacterium]
MSSPEQRKCVSVEDLQTIREELRSQGKRVVQCHGCFDIVHPGHIRYLRFAREQGDALIVSVSGDDVVGKGFDRPYINETLRLENLAALEFVDYVCLDHHTWAGPILEIVKPDVYVKGKEYETNADPRFLKEKKLVEDYGGTVIFSSGDVVYSSTFIINQFRHRFDLEQQKINFFCRRNQITIPALEELMHHILERRVLVIGDPILDQYIHCEALSVAAESPILSVTPLQDQWFIGGAALIARQMARLGARVSLMTTMGPGAESHRFVQLLGEADVELVPIQTENRPLYIKSRYLVDETKVFKVNHGRYSPMSTGTLQQMMSTLKARVDDYEAIVVTDFGYGMFSASFIEALTELSREHGIPSYVDVSSTGQASILKFKSPRLAMPNEDELRFALGDNESGLSHLASRYFRETRADRLVLTLGKRGAILFTPDEDDTSQRLHTDYLPSLATQSVDPVGAGDVFLATTALADLCDAPLAHSIYLGSAMAALHVGILGNDPPTAVDLRTYLAERQELRS